MTQVLSKEPSQREISDRVNLILDGKLNNIGTVTLTANQTTTTVTDYSVHDNSTIFLMPQTSNAAGESPYISSVSSNQFIITHASTATTDRTFFYIFLG